MTIAIPIAAPRYGLPPKRRVAEKPTKIGKKANGAEASKLMMPAKSFTDGYNSTTD